MLVYEPCWATKILKGKNPIRYYQDFDEDMIYDIHKGFYIYTISSEQASNIVKIGYSCDPYRRVKQLQTGSERKLEVSTFKGPFFHPEVKEIEQTIHDKLSDFRLHGEWFNSPKEHVDCVIEEVISSVPNLFMRIYNTTGIDIFERYKEVTIEQSVRKVITHEPNDF